MRLRVLWLVILVIAGLWGCTPQEGRSGPGRHRSGDGDAVWPFWPAELRIHPLTRVVRNSEENKVIVEARVEFFDAERASTKAVGQLVIQLHAAAPGASDDAIQTWNQDLRDLDLNKRQYDDLHRMYLFRLQIEPAVFPQQPELRVYFVGADGNELKATMRLKP